MLAHVVKHMATKEDLAGFPTKDEVRDMLKPVETRLMAVDRRLDSDAMKRDLEQLPARVDAIEKHLGISKRIA
jgi:hypothetical protein